MDIENKKRHVDDAGMKGVKQDVMNKQNSCHQHEHQPRTKRRKGGSLVPSIHVLQLIPTLQLVPFVVRRAVHQNLGMLLTTRNRDCLSQFLGGESMHLIECCDEDDDISFPSVHMMFGFLASEKLTESNMLLAPDAWEFAATTTFAECWERDDVGFGQWLEDSGINLIVLGTETEWYNQGVDVDALYDFVASLVKHNIRVWPPLSIVNTVRNKYKRDQCFQMLKLPQVWVQIDENIRSWNDAMMEAKGNGLCGTEEDIFVFKTSKGSACNGVYQVEHGSNGWDEVDSRALPAMGTLVSVEPFASELRQAEERVLFHFFDQSRTVDLTYVSATANKGIIETYPASRQTNLSKQKLVDTLRKRVALALRSSPVGLTTSLANLVFRMDCFATEMKEDDTTTQKQSQSVLLNELEVFPVCYDLIDSYDACPRQVEELAECIVKYIKRHWQSGWQV